MERGDGITKIRVGIIAFLGGTACPWFIVIFINHLHRYGQAQPVFAARRDGLP